MTAAKDKSIVGKTLAAIAKERNESPIDAAIQIVRTADLRSPPST